MYRDSISPLSQFGLEFSSSGRGLNFLSAEFRQASDQHMQRLQHRPGKHGLPAEDQVNHSLLNVFGIIFFFIQRSELQQRGQGRGEGWSEGAGGKVTTLALQLPEIQWVQRNHIYIYHVIKPTREKSDWDGLKSTTSQWAHDMSRKHMIRNKFNWQDTCPTKKFSESLLPIIRFIREFGNTYIWNLSY